MSDRWVLSKFAQVFDSHSSNCWPKSSWISLTSLLYSAPVLEYVSPMLFSSLITVVTLHYSRCHYSNLNELTPSNFDFWFYLFYLYWNCLLSFYFQSARLLLVSNGDTSMTELSSKMNRWLPLQMKVAVNHTLDVCTTTLKLGVLTTIRSKTNTLKISSIFR